MNNFLFTSRSLLLAGRSITRELACIQVCCRCSAFPFSIHAVAFATFEIQTQMSHRLFERLPLYSCNLTKKVVGCQFTCFPFFILRRIFLRLDAFLVEALEFMLVLFSTFYHVVILENSGEKNYGKGLK